MNEADIPIDIHTLKLQDWLVSRRIVPKSIQAPLKTIRSKINSNEELIKLFSGANINYYQCKEIVEILKQTEKETKSVFGRYSSQRMKDFQEILRLYEKDNVYLAETAQIFVRNVKYEIPGVRKQMTKLEQQSDECLKRIQDLGKPEAQLLAEHAALLQQLGVKGENLREEFSEVLRNLPELYAQSISDIGTIQKAIELYADCSGQKLCLPILRHLIEFGNTTVYQYLHKEAPLSVEEPPIKLNFTEGNDQSNNGGAGEAEGEGEIDFGGDDNGGTSSTISAEIIDFGDFNTEGEGLGEPNATDIDWGIESAPAETEEINIKEYGIVVEGVGMDGGTAKGDQAYTLLDSPNYRDRFLDELSELEAFLNMRLFDLNQLDASSNIMFSLMENYSTHDGDTIRKMLTNLENILQKVDSEHTRHLFQLKHSPKYADLLASKLKQMTKAVDKIRANKEELKQRSSELKTQRVELNPVLTELITQTKQLQSNIEKDISKRYKNRVVNLLGGVN